MIVPYHQYMPFIVNGYKPLYTHFFTKPLTLTFDNYVKSQLHLNVVSDLYGRDIFQYDKTLKYLRGDDRYLLECLYVLRYFYQDVTNTLCNVLRRTPDHQSKITIDSSLGRSSKLPVRRVEVRKVVSELKGTLGDDQEESSGVYGGVLTKFSYNEIDKLQANETLALAAIFLYYGSNSEETYVVEVIE